ncbi:deoxyhypusine synthase-like [Branchiostoma floridae]|uniref:Deoxyhypusine synthase n=1 Tax=Branchiostoma floridae TaxID=7739 RepID=A0A9J7MIS8_BRAFL|nr:deoxyhypusine synthase-like [Branchiostoma floridae]
MADAATKAEQHVWVKSMDMPDDAIKIKGFDFNKGVKLDEVVKHFLTTGFQASNFGMAIEQINKMREHRSKPVNLSPEEEKLDPIYRPRSDCTIFLGYTSNMVSSGIRETIRFLAQHRMIDCIVTTAGGIEEDFIKCFAPTYLGDFSLKGKDLRPKVCEQKQHGTLWTPSKLIARLGKEIDNEESIYYWCYKNEIPVFSPAITDGSIGDLLFLHAYRNPGLVLDIVEDIKMMNSIAAHSKHSGMIILGGGLPKHHIHNANFMKGGADYGVFINTAQEFDGSDGGARPDEAVSWGKIKSSATPVKIFADATLVFPLLVSQTFAKDFKSDSNGQER